MYPPKPRVRLFCEWLILNQNIEYEFKNSTFLLIEAQPCRNNSETTESEKKIAF